MLKRPRFTDEHRFKQPYKKAVETDIRRSIERAKKELALKAEEAKAREAQAAATLRPFKREAR